VLYTLYRILGIVCYPFLVITLPLFERYLSRAQLYLRLGQYQAVARSEGQGVSDRSYLLWIHAASVGEVQAARALIAVVSEILPEATIFLTTMTRQGRAVAQSLFPAEVRCELAPLDMAPAVKRALRRVQPDLYICLETELWPVMLTEVRKAGVSMLLLNGRISGRSFRQYQRIQKTLAPLLAGFSAVSVISEQDRERFHQLGVPDERLQVCGNMKYMQQSQDGSGQESVELIQQKYARLLGIQDDQVIFICGSTRTGEEELLVPVYTRLQEKYADKLLWIIAPRHLARLPEVKALLEQAGLGYNLFSQFPEGDNKKRQKNIILLDRMGELARIYAVGHYNFCGGSLVNQGGHNIMESIAQQKPIFFGPFMQDFQDAVDFVLTAGAGVQVRSADELADYLLEHPLDSSVYKQTCQAAERLARSHQGAAQRQAELVLRVMNVQRV
jgi:3-deoxy-D-manno-octulosonic-acid transferase